MASERTLLLAVVFLAIAAGSTSRPLRPDTAASFAGFHAPAVAPRLGGALEPLVTSEVAAPGAVATKLSSPPLAVSGRALHPAMPAAGALAPPAPFLPSSKQGLDDLAVHRTMPERARDPPSPGLILAIATGSTSRASRPLHPGVATSFAGLPAPRVGGAQESLVTSELTASGAVATKRSPPLVVSGRALQPAMPDAAVAVFAPPAPSPPDDLDVHRVITARAAHDPPAPGKIIAILLGVLAVTICCCCFARKRKMRAAAREQWISPNDLALV